MSKKHKCSECEFDFEHYNYYKYNDKVYCESCLLDKLVGDDVLEETLITDYYTKDGIYIGNNDGELDLSYVDEVENI